jgi:hypothetical protein
MNDKFIEELNNWCDDHYKHFGCYPLEFEFEDKVYKFEQFEKYLTTRGLV